jgi:hypothetical protein
MANGWYLGEDLRAFLTSLDEAGKLDWSRAFLGGNFKLQPRHCFRSPQYNKARLQLQPEEDYRYYHPADSCRIVSLPWDPREERGGTLTVACIRNGRF